MDSVCRCDAHRIGAVAARLSQSEAAAAAIRDCTISSRMPTIASTADGIAGDYASEHGIEHVEYTDQYLQSNLNTRAYFPDCRRHPHLVRFQDSTLTDIACISFAGTIARSEPVPHAIYTGTGQQRTILYEALQLPSALIIALPRILDATAPHAIGCKSSDRGRACEMARACLRNAFGWEHIVRWKNWSHWSHWSCWQD